MAQASAVLGRGSGRRWENPDMRAPPVSGWRDRAAYPFGGEGKWAVGSFSGRAESDPRPFSYFLFFFLFSFSNFLYFFHIICKFDLNQVKPFLEIL
jgi:hypothetical protein